jgi:hypothetical protein
LRKVSNSQPLIESNETQVWLISLLPHKSLKIGDSEPEVIVALDAATVSSASKESEKRLKAGDFVWLNGASGDGRSYKNTGDKNSRLIEIVFKKAK